MITGFPSPAQGYEQKGIDFNSILIKHPSATVVMKIESSNYTCMGIYNGDITKANLQDNLDALVDSITGTLTE